MSGGSADVHRAPFWAPILLDSFRHSSVRPGSASVLLRLEAGGRDLGREAERHERPARQARERDLLPCATQCYEQIVCACGVLLLLVVDPDLVFHR